MKRLTLVLTTGPRFPTDLRQQLHVFDTDGVETRGSPRPSSECSSCLVGELTVNLVSLRCDAVRE